MRVAVAGDHACFALKQMLAEQLRREGHEVSDLGAFNAERSDYPDFAQAVGEALQQGRDERGIVICGSGVGACIAANKMRSIRACVCHDTYSAHQGIEHDDMNVICLGGQVLGNALARELLETFLAARFTGEERHTRRLKKIADLEQGQQ